MGIALFLMTISAALLAGLLKAEIEAWLPKVCDGLRKLAVRLLPVNLRVTYDEEWSSFLRDVPGSISKLVASIGFNIAAINIAVQATTVAYTRIALLARDYTDAPGEYWFAVKCRQQDIDIRKQQDFQPNEEPDDGTCLALVAQWGVAIAPFGRQQITQSVGLAMIVRNLPSFSIVVFNVNINGTRVAGATCKSRNLFFSKYWQT